MITLPFSPAIVRPGTTPLRVLRDIETERAADGARRTLMEGTRLTYVDRASLDGSTLLVLSPLSAEVVYVPADAVGIDLEDATGRAHVAWWVGAQFGLRCPPIAWWWNNPRSGSLFTVGDVNNGRTEFGPPSDSAVSPGWWVIVPALAHLDPTDDTLLPDGSRVVDAEALRVVTLHLLERGQEQPR